jgi:hypothetical protein
MLKIANFIKSTKKKTGMVIKYTAFLFTLELLSKQESDKKIKMADPTSFSPKNVKNNPAIKYKIPWQVQDFMNKKITDISHSIIKGAV